jgi:hypothetical protein
MLTMRPSVVAAAEDASALTRNRALVQRLFADGVNGGDEALVAAHYAPGFAGDGTNAGDIPAPVGMPISLREFREAAPDVTATVDALVAEGDLVAVFVTWRGPHPPAGTHIEGQTMHLFRMALDQIIEEWSAGWDWLEDRGVR